MESLNFDLYFESTDNQYYDSKYIIIILENILGHQCNDIKNTVTNTQVVVTKEQIIEFLEKRFEEENPELKKRIESEKPKRNDNIAKWADEEIKALSQELVDYISARR